MIFMELSLTGGKKDWCKHCLYSKFGIEKLPNRLFTLSSSIQMFIQIKDFEQQRSNTIYLEDEIQVIKVYLLFHLANYSETSPKI